MRKIIVPSAAAVAIVLLALGLTPGAAQAQQIEIGPVTVCHLVTFFDIVIFEYDCHTGG